MQQSWTKAPTQPLTRLIPAATSFDSVRRSCFLPLRRGASKIYRTLTCTNALSRLFRRHVFASLQFSVHFYNQGFTTNIVRCSPEVLHAGPSTPSSGVLDSTKALLLDCFLLAPLHGLTTLLCAIGEINALPTASTVVHQATAAREKC